MYVIHLYAGTFGGLFAICTGGMLMEANVSLRDKRSEWYRSFILIES